MKYFYNTIFSLFAIVSIPSFVARLNQAKDWRVMLKERLGKLSYVPFRRRSVQQIIWLHAVSVGEVMALRRLIELMEKRYDNALILITTTTPTGHEIAEKMAREHIHVYYAPFDLSFVVKRVLDRLKPDIIVLMETEIWPNLILEATRRQIPIGIVNGRISDRSFGRYKWVRFLIRPLLEHLSFCLVQSDCDRERFLKLGVLERQLHQVGNMKFDQMDVGPHLKGSDPIGVKKVALETFSREHFVLIGGSTSGHEEALLLDVFARLQEVVSGLRMILAPRHPERVSEVEREINKRNISFRKWSDAGRWDDCSVLLLDRMGTLSSLYRFSDVVFMGGSLTKRGGQNPIEPAQFQKPILHGPHVFNFREIYRRLDQDQSAFCVHSEEDLFQKLRILFDQVDLRKQMGMTGFQTIQSMKGATQRTLDCLDLWLHRDVPSVVMVS